MKPNSSPIKTFAIPLITTCAALLLLAGAITSRAADGIWTNDASSIWSTVTNWAGGNVADDFSATAYFTNEITAIRTVTVDAPAGGTVRTNGYLVFGDDNLGTPGGWIVSGVPIRLSASGTPAITVNAMNNGTINATNDVVITSVLVTSQGYVKNGPGTLTLTAANLITNLSSPYVVQINQGAIADVNSAALAPRAWGVAFNGGALIHRPNNNSYNNTNYILTTGTIIVTNSNIGDITGPFIGNASATLNFVLPNNSIGANGSTVAGNSNQFMGFAGTINVAAGPYFDPTNFFIWRWNSASHQYYGSSNAVINAVGTDDIRLRTRGTANQTIVWGALNGGSKARLQGTIQADVSTTYQIGDANVPCTFSGTVENGYTSGIMSLTRPTSLRKTGTSTFTLGGTNTYTGSTTIANGTLVLLTPAPLTNTPSIAITGTGGILDVSAFTSSGGWTNWPGQYVGGVGSIAGKVTMAGGFLVAGNGTNIGNLRFDNDLTLAATTMTNRIASGTNDSVTVAGNLDLSGGTTTINLAPPPGLALLPNSTNVLFQWGGALTGDLSNLQLQYSPQAGNALISLKTNLVTRQISLIVVSNTGSQLVWKGDSANNVWDHSTANWLRGATAAVFTNLDDVTFNDSGVASVPVSLSDNAVPASIIVSNNLSAYTFSGGGQISGAAGLTKNGTNTLTVLQDNSFSGTVTVNAGTVIVGNGSSGGAGSLGSGTLVNNSTVIYKRDTTLTFGSPLQGSGTLVQDSTNGNTMILTAESSNPGNIWVKAGTLQFGSGASGNFSGSFTGIITNNATLTYLYDGNKNIYNSLAGDGVVNFNSVSGNRQYTFALEATSPGYIGTINIAAGVSVHAQGLNMGCQFGSGNTVNVPYLGQAWLDNLATNAVTTNYSSTFVIQGPGWSGDALPVGHVSGDLVGLGALRLFNCTLTGPITLLGDTRIGSSSSGGTIQGQISDNGNNYQLEIVTSSANWDNAQTLAPASGPNPFSRLLITSGTLTAGNTNAFTNQVSMMAWGRMRLNGYNLAIASLSGGTTVGTTNCYVYNYSAANPATLTVGTDGSSQQFDGIFANGNTQPLGITKVGGGTWTLTGISTNTGSVTVNGGTLSLSGSGSFSNSTLLAVSSGAYLNVSGRDDGTLSLNNGQTLKGSGTVQGQLNALAGSIINPGDTVGTLNAQNNVTLGGTLLLDLSRPSSCDHLTSSGTITYGGILAVTNVGAALQVGDMFQLFSSGTTGFAAINLQTNDWVNNVKYTWTDTIGSNGRITVASVSTLVNTNSTNIVFNITGNTLHLSWPEDHRGWTLQTNSIGLEAPGSWFPYPGSASLTNVDITIDQAKAKVFYRLVYP